MIWKKKQFWGGIIAVALLAYCLKDISIYELRGLGEKIDMLYLIPSIIATYLFIVVKALRWRVIISSQKEMTYGRAIPLYSAGQILNIVMPMLTGQVGRLFLFSREEGIKKTVIFSTILLEIIFDAVSLVLFLFLTSLAFVFPEEYRTMSVVILAVTIFVVGLLYFILHRQVQLEGFGRRHFRDRWPGFYISVKKFLRSFSKGIELLRSSQHMISSMSYSLLSWVLHTLVIFFLLKAFGLTLPFSAAAAIMIINTLAVMIPVTPGNAGTFELAVSSSLAAFSVGRSDAVMFALALHLLDFLPIFSFGFFFLRKQKVSIRQIKSEHEDDVVLDQVSEEGIYIEDEEKV